MKLKRILAIVLSVLILCGAVPADVGDWFKLPDFSMKASAATDSLKYGNESGITRAEWLYDLTLVFDMFAEEEYLPDNYFSDLDESHKYYDAIINAVQYGVIDIPAGEELKPDEYVTRDFAASTLNFCLGYQPEEGKEYTFTDIDAVSSPDSAQIALNRKWFDLIEGAFSPETLITSAQVKTMLDDAAEVLEKQVVDTGYDNTYEFAEDVIVLPEDVEASEDENGIVSIIDSPETIAVNDKFAVYYNGIPVVYTAQSVAMNDNVTVIETESVETEEAFTEVDAQGVIDSSAMEIVPADGVDVSVDEGSGGISTFAIKKTKTLKAELPIKAGGVTGKISVKIENPYIDYSTSSNGGYVTLNGETTVTYSISASLAQAAGLSKGFTLFTVNIFGVGSFDVSVMVDFSGTASGTVKGFLTAGVQVEKGVGIRAIRGFLQHESYTSVEAETKVSLKATLGVTKMPVISAYIYAEVGVKANFSKKTFADDKTPHQCTHFAAYLFAEYGASASAKLGWISYEESIKNSIYTESNSPMRVVNHYEDGNLVAKCTRGTNYSNFFTKVNSRWSGCGWIGANGAYGLNADGTPFKLYNYTLNENNEATITKYNGNAWSVNIPKEIDGYKVVAIGNRAFENKSIGYVNIPDTVTTIGNAAFKRCEVLRSVKLSTSLTYLGEDAFGYTAIEEIEIPKTLDSCYLHYWGGYEYGGYKFDSYFAMGPFVHCDSLKKVTFEKGTTQVAEALFAGCTGLESITIPDTVTIIERAAFGGCARLREVIIGNAVTVIDDEAFQNCITLTNVDIPNSVTEINDFAFERCEVLRSVKLSTSLTYLGEDAFGYTAIEEIEIPKTLDSCYLHYWGGYEYGGYKFDSYFAMGPFVHCDSLKKVTFEKGTTQVAEALFAGCTGLETITIPDTVTIIERAAFGGCARLREVIIGNAVTVIDDEAFQNCIALTSIDIPDSVTQIGESTFRSCWKLKSVKIPVSTKRLGSSCFELCSSLESVELPNLLLEIPSYAFKNCTSLKIINFPQTVQIIQNSAFYGCSSLESISFSNGSTLKEIQNYAFEGCASLKEVVLPETTKSIGNYAFQNCTSLEKVVIPQSTKNIYSQAFMGCESLKDVSIADYSITKIESNTFKDCPSLESIVLPKGLTTIGSQAFMNDTALVSVTIPESVTAIDSTAFSYPLKTTIYGKTGSYAETFAKDGGFTFKDISIPIQGIILKDGVENVILEVGETYRAEFEVYPEDGNDVVTLTANNNNISIEGHDLYARNSGDTVVTATTSGGMNYDFNIHIRRVSKIEIASNPTKTTYLMGEKFDPTGMVVRACYNDNSIRNITDYTITGFDSSAEGENTITIKWTAPSGSNYSTSVKLEILDPNPKLTGIYIATNPTKVQYELREQLDLSGMVVMGTYTDHQDRVITDYTVSGYNLLLKGVQTITVTFQGFTDTFTVMVGKVEILPGDTSGNGELHMDDAVLVLRYLLEGDSVNELAADFNGDGVVRISDAVLILRKLSNNLQ